MLVSGAGSTVPSFAVIDISTEAWFQDCAPHATSAPQPGVNKVVTFTLIEISTSVTDIPPHSVVDAFHVS